MVALNTSSKFLSKSVLGHSLIFFLHPPTDKTKSESYKKIVEIFKEKNCKKSPELRVLKLKFRSTIWLWFSCQCDSNLQLQRILSRLCRRASIRISVDIVWVANRRDDQFYELHLKSLNKHLKCLILKLFTKNSDCKTLFYGVLNWSAGLGISSAPGWKKF